MNDQIIECELFSKGKVDAIRSELGELLQRKDYAVVVNGSYARGEASAESDLDYFIICESAEAEAQAKSDLGAIKEVLRKHIPKGPAKGGVFEEVELIDKMGRNIGGPNDDNGKITRRVLFLLEGDWLFNPERFNKYREVILSKYIDNTISDHQFCRFLLNDVIRYYRTVCVDYEHKTREEGKAWGSRNIKLVFSRKLMYFSGILVAAETWQQTYETKLTTLRALLAMTPVRRAEIICGEKAAEVLNAYGRFLHKLALPELRRMLEDDIPEERERRPEAFRVFKNEGHHFSWMLVKLLRETYDYSHPIHNALIV